MHMFNGQAVWKFFLSLSIGLACVWPYSSAQAETLADRVRGRILLQVENHGEAWYINPDDDLRYYLGRPKDAFDLMRGVGLGITTENLKRIPKPDEPWTADQNFFSQVSGRIVLQVEKHGEAWYINPVDGKRYYLGRPSDAFELMTNFGLGASNTTLNQIGANVQISAVQPNEGNEGGEYVEITNYGKVKEQLEGWKLSNGEGATFTFPEGTELKSGKSIQVYTNQGSYQFASSSPLWNNQDDTAYLYGPRDAVIDEYSYSISPASYLIPVPFTTQAPTGNWGSPFGEACEEAILVMLHQWHEGVIWSSTQVRDEILSIVEWEQATYGYDEDTSASVTANTAQDYYHLPMSVTSDVSIERIKHFVSHNRPVAIPVYGKYLNPHYTAGGPLYHMVLIVGYDEDDFITHDPGTSFGKNYYYDQDTLYNAIHDLMSPERDTIYGPKKMVVFGQE